ncbi:serpin family protein [Bradyrhizobium sp. USDA 4473]
MRGQRLGRAILTILVAASTPMACVADEADNQSLVTAFNASGHDLLKQFVATPGNVVFSPYSIGSAVAMVLSGAKGDTAIEMASVLHQGLDRDRMDAANADVLGRLKNEGTPATAPTCLETERASSVSSCERVEQQDRGSSGRVRTQGKRYAGSPIVRSSASLGIANAVMLTKEAIASDAYIKRIEQNYAAKVFRNAKLEEINGWVKRMTEGKIDSILDRPAKEGIVLVDAIYFKQAWQRPFALGETKNDDFHLSPARTIKAATMHQRSYFPIVSRPGFRAIRLPYLTWALSMVIVLPDAVDGAPALAQRLGTSEVSALFSALRQEKEVNTYVSLPRFKIRFSAKLKDRYQQLGLMRPFDEARADFSGITGRSKELVRVWIDDILHRATLEVTENGSEAAAATAVSMAEITMANKPEPFTVDRPFLFYVADDRTAAILFAGCMSNPGETN